MAKTDPRIPCKLSRRDLVAATAALPLVGARQPHTGSSAGVACSAWLAKTAEIERLLLKWGDVEAWLAKELGWFKLSEAERNAEPKRRALTEIDQRIDWLVSERDILLRSLPGLAAMGRSDIVLKVQVASHFLPAEDFPEARALILSVLRDLGAAPLDA